MGMAASQARFLGLTARKSNVEYQGQQVNQQRTALSNESSNLYSQMMDLEVPTPPSSTDYKKTSYVLEDSSDSYAHEDYTIGNVTKTYNAEGQYLVTLTSKQEEVSTSANNYKLQSIRQDQIEKAVYKQKSQDGKLIYQDVNEENKPLYYSVNSTGEKLYYADESQTGEATTTVTEWPKKQTAQNSYPVETTENTGLPIYETDAQGNKIQEAVNEGTKYTFTLANRNSNATLVYNTLDDDAYTGQNKSIQVNQNQIYKLDKTKSVSPDGYNECLANNPDIAYFYQSGDKNYFLTEGELNSLINGDTEASVNPSYKHTYYKDISTQVLGYIESSGDTGRYSTLTIESNEEYPEILNGKTFNLTYKEEPDEAAYQDAFNDYEYKKALYDKAVDEINAKTEILQKQDQNLELRLKQLDTEQNAIKTEMDSVKNVLKDNVEKTFNTFG